MKVQKQVSMEKSIKELNELLVQQTAELALKNRELELEVALEKVRARAMKMQKSDELAETAFVLFQQFKELGEAPDQITIGMIREEVGLIEFWVTIDGKQVDHKVEASVKESSVMKKMFTAWMENKRSLVIDLMGKPLHDYISYRTKISETIEKQAIKDYSENRRVIHCAFFSKGLISFSSAEPKPLETVRLLERFSGVFDQTYTRFLDLQKAEAHAREAQIETALERVRSRSMAMHKSDELRDVIQVIYDQLVQLNFEISNAGFLMDYRETVAWNLWMADDGTEFPTKQHIPYIDHPFSNDFLEHQNKGPELFTKIYSYEEKNSWLEHVFKYISVPEEAKEFLYSSPALAISRLLLKNIGLYLMNFNGTPYSDSENSTLIRFGKVFEQTYTRFLDLQKAEAQAREAQIETALERIRSRSLAMHKSDDLQEVIAIVLEQLQKLGIKPEASYINIFYEDTRDIDMWIATPGQEYAQKIHVPYFKHPVFDDYWLAKDRGETFLASDYSLEEKNSFFKYAFEHSDLKIMPDDRKKHILESKGYTRSLAWSKNSALVIQNYEGNPYTNQENEIIIRFARVFEQAYTRFLDVKKAEEQAREAQIESALERVRGKAMGMHTSEDLAATILAFYHELVGLSSVPIIRCGAGLPNKENYIADISSVSKTSAGELVEAIGKLDMNGHPMLKDVYDHWLIQQEYHNVLRGNEIKTYYQFVRGQLAIPDYPDDAVQYFYYPMFKEGSFYVITENELSERELQIYRRFTSVLSLTYKRYKELKDSEERTRIAIREASLDRVRAEIASMRHADDLQRITPLIWRELLALGVPFFRCGVMIMDEKEEMVRFYLSTPDGKSLAVLNLGIDSLTITKNGVEHWRRQKVYTETWNKEQFISFMKPLMAQGQIETAATYQGGEEPPALLTLQFVPFPQGMLYVGSSKPLASAEIEPVKALAEAFSVAYARYEDFTNLESAKSQVEQTLQDLRAAQTQLIQSEKMASLGELTAGIAHEIQNPLNFINNFSEVNKELIAEMREEIANGNYEEVDALAKDVGENEEKIIHHGKRADAIVKGMLQHSRSSSGIKELTNINSLAEEYFRLAYHGLRAKDKSFNVTMKTDFDETIGKINIIPQDIGRVILNLITNAFYAADEKKKQTGAGYEPTVSVSTKKINGRVEISVADNGNGIPHKALDKIFQPFFTTKPAGQGTGLGLSLAYDIIKAHGGELKVETREGEGVEMIIIIPV